MSRRIARANDEHGMTVAELMVAVMLTAVVMIPLASGIFLALRTSQTSEGRIEESSSANVLASYFGTDVQNAVSVGVNVNEATGACGGAAMNVGLLLTTQTDQSSIAYYRGSGANGTDLYRRTCTGGSVTSTVRVLHNLSSAPNFACAPSCDSNWQSVTATVTQQKALDAGGYATTVSGTRRVG
jgi:hypothetical protein